MTGEYGVYKVTGKREYMGVEPGEEFEAQLDPGPESRAVARGDIVLLRRVIPSIEAGLAVFPQGWLDE